MTDPSTEESAADIQEMAKLGLVPEKFGSVTLSKQYAAQTGAEVKHNFGTFLYGPKGIDIRARLVMYRLAKAINPDATPKEMYLFVNQLGNYTRSLAGQSRALPEGQRMEPVLHCGLDHGAQRHQRLDARGPMPKSGAGLRAWQMISGCRGVDRPVARRAQGLYRPVPVGGPSLEIPVRAPEPQGPRLLDRTADLGAAAAGDAYVGVGFFSPLVKRGAGALGISGTYDAYREGGSIDQMMDGGRRGRSRRGTAPRHGSAVARSLDRGHWHGALFDGMARRPQQVQSAIPVHRRAAAAGSGGISETARSCPRRRHEQLFRQRRGGYRADPRHHARLGRAGKPLGADDRRSRNAATLLAAH